MEPSVAVIGIGFLFSLADLKHPLVLMHPRCLHFAEDKPILNTHVNRVPNCVPNKPLQHGKGCLGSKLHVDVTPFLCLLSYIYCQCREKCSALPLCGLVLVSQISFQR